MAITPDEILMKEFNNKFRGYDPEQVNDFLDIVRVQLEKALEENRILSKDLSDANDKLDYFGQLQESLNSSIIIAQEAADRLKQNARKEAELILYEAEREADRLIKDASDQSHKIYEETENLRQSTQRYREKMRQLIQNQLEVVNNEEFEELFEGSALTPAQAQSPVQVNNVKTQDKVDALVEQAEAEMQVGFDAIPEDKHNYLGQTEKITEEEIVFPSKAETEEEDLDLTQIFTKESLEFERPADEEKFNTIPLSREELEAYERHQKEQANQQNSSTSQEEASDEDLYGETIRIDLPREE